MHIFTSILIVFPILFVSFPSPLKEKQKRKKEKEKKRKNFPFLNEDEYVGTLVFFVNGQENDIFRSHSSIPLDRTRLC